MRKDVQELIELYENRYARCKCGNKVKLKVKGSLVFKTADSKEINVVANCINCGLEFKIKDYKSEE